MKLEVCIEVFLQMYSGQMKVLNDCLSYELISQVFHITIIAWKNDYQANNCYSKLNTHYLED